MKDRCQGSALKATLEMFDSMICAKYVITILARLDSIAVVIECIKHHGKAIHECNIQNHKGKAKAYQIRQVLKALEKLEADDGA